jgi:hypothetical protein
LTHVEATMVGHPRRKRVRTRHRHAFDRRTKLGRRVLALTAAFRQQLGEHASDTVVAANIVKAARLQALSEDASAKAINGAPIDMDTVIRLARVSDLAVKRLHLDRAETKQAPFGLKAYEEQLFGKREGDQ